MSKREIRHTESYDDDDSVNARPVTSNEVNYNDGYAHGRVNENLRQQEQKVREENNSMGGLLLGILITGFVGLIAGTTFFFYYNQRGDTDSTTPVPETPAATEPQDQPRNTTIIERTIERTKDVVPVPQQQPSGPTIIEAPPAPAPNVEVNIPNPTNQEPASTEPPVNQNPPQPSQESPDVTTENNAPATQAQ